ncbi:shikimate dehydrogenase [Loktanella fryxellensis]|uniref:Shikimate dehydrogenase (NADP(+)) n=1 Tax=Loktanella fryxellensis TaxID=245187 RepID=A0A1H8DWZ5_9RHOB|nr:shikimate dehydrogenase [Loktanella fryxellensis]SEN11782.1 shikimate dehydrogenase [Loktanella fryxellensis]
MTDAATTRPAVPLAGVIGNPIGQSRSPLMHKHWLQRYGLRGDYVPLQVREGDLDAVIRALPRMGFVGANVTIPHKTAVLRIADHVSDRAAAIGAANTLIFRDDGSIHADNTDGYGFMANLRAGAPDWDPRGGPAVVLGAGGAARAILVALADAGVPQIFLANRTRNKADGLRAEFGDHIKVVDWTEVSVALPQANLLINTTSLGMTGQPPLHIDLDTLQPHATVTDIVYAPLQTPLLSAAAARGCVTVDGLGMLLHQGVPGFEHWFGRRPEVDDALRAAVLV